MGHALVNGVLMKPYPWDDVDSVFHGYLNAYNILHAGSFTELLTAINDGRYHALGSMLSTLGFLFGDQPAVAYLLVVLLTLFPLAGAIIVLRAPWWTLVPVFLVSPFFLRASTTFKTDLVGGLAFGALATILLTLVQRNREPSRLELWITSCIGIVALTAKMTSLVNPVFYILMFAGYVFLRVVHTRYFVDEGRVIGVPAVTKVTLLSRTTVYALAIPSLCYVLFFLLQFRELSDYIHSVLGADSIWKDSDGFFSRVSAVYFNNWGTVSFLPAFGSQYAAGTVTLGAFAAILGLFRPLIFWRSIILFFVGAAYVLALAWASPVTNPWFAAPGYGLMHFAVLDFLLALRLTSLRPALAPVLAVFVGCFFMATTENGWQVNGFDGNGRDYAALIEAVAEAVHGVENPIIVQTASGSPVPEPNISYELLRSHVVGKWTWTARVDRIEDLDPLLATANALIVVRTLNKEACDYIPSCERSNEIADRVEAMQGNTRIASFTFPKATLTVYRKNVPAM